MSEKRFLANPQMPTGYESLAGIEQVVKEDGSIRHNGLVKLGEGDAEVERKVSLNVDPLRMWGYQDDYEQYKSDPEAWKQKQLVEQLLSRVESLETLVEGLRADKAQLEQEVAVLRQQQPQPVGSAPEAVPAQAEASPPASSTPNIDVLLARAAQRDQTAEPEQVVIIPAEAAESVVVTSADDPNGTPENVIVAPADEVEAATITPPGQAPNETDSPTVVLPNADVVEEPEADAVEEVDEEELPRRGLRRRIGDLVLGAQVRMHNGAANLIDRRRPDEPIVLSEEEVQEYHERSERVGGRVLGGVAIGGALGLLAGYLIWHKTGHNVAEGTQTVTVPGQEVTVTVPGNSAGQITTNTIHVTNFHNRNGMDIGYVSPGTTREYLHGANNGFAVDLPKGAHFRNNANGTVSIIGPKGDVWVDKLQGDQQGNLARTIRQSLATKFKLHQDWLTYNDTTGPGKHGLVRHYVTAIVGRK